MTRSTIPVSQTYPPSMAVVAGGLVALPVEPAHPLYDRWDLVVATTDRNAIVVDLITGTPATSPQIPPTDALILARLRVRANDVTVGNGNIWMDNR
jgi:hypothetical protein